MSAIKQSVNSHSKRRVAYYYDDQIGNFNFGADHHMKPSRIRLAHQLVLGYGIFRQLEIYRPFPASLEDITRFHSEDYASILENVKPDQIKNMGACLKRYNIDSDDCPVFEGLYEFCTLSSGGSLSAALRLNNEHADIAINWMGGLHHAKKGEASGFCYTNDIVLGILELLKYHKRVLYVDIDVHHGDGVEEAFYTTDRVMCVSFHKYDGSYFPRSGSLTDTGHGVGRGYSLNVPLRDGITDEAYQSIFKPIMESVMDRYRPDAIVLQCGADSLADDELGKFNLTLRGHGECVSFLRSYRIPMMLLGGGGYTPRNVARCWAYETGLAVGRELPNELPLNDYMEYYGPSNRLHYEPKDVKPNQNSIAYLRQVQNTVLEQLAALPFAPSVQMQAVAADSLRASTEASAVLKDAADPDKRLHNSIMDAHVEHEAEYYDAGTEGNGGRNEHSGKRAAAADPAESDDDIVVVFDSAAEAKHAAKKKAAAAAAEPAPIRRSSRLSKPSAAKRKMSDEL